MPTIKSLETKIEHLKLDIEDEKKEMQRLYTQNVESAAIQSGIVECHWNLSELQKDLRRATQELEELYAEENDQDMGKTETSRWWTAEMQRITEEINKKY